MSEDLRRFFLDVWRRCGRVDVAVDPRIAGVKLPSRFMSLKNVLLEIIEGPTGQNMLIGVGGFAVKLKFDGKMFDTFIPWPALSTITDPLRHVTFIQHVGVLNAEPTKQPVQVRRPTKVPFLSVIDGGKGRGPDVA